MPKAIKRYTNTFYPKDIIMDVAATRTIDETGTRTRAMERRLRSVEQLSSADTATILTLPGVASVAVESDEEAGAAANEPSTG